MARVKFEPESNSSHEPSSSQVPSFYFSNFFFFLCLLVVIFLYIMTCESQTERFITVWFAIFFVIDRLSHYHLDSLPRYKDIPSPIHEFSKKIKDLYLLPPEAEIPFPRLRKRTVKDYSEYPLLKRHLVYVHRTPKIKCKYQ